MNRSHSRVPVGMIVQNLYSNMHEHIYTMSEHNHAAGCDIENCRKFTCNLFELIYTM